MRSEAKTRSDKLDKDVTDLKTSTTDLAKTLPIRIASAIHAELKDLNPEAHETREASTQLQANEQVVPSQEEPCNDGPEDDLTGYESTTERTGVVSTIKRRIRRGIERSQERYREEHLPGQDGQIQTEELGGDLSDGISILPM